MSGYKTKIIILLTIFFILGCKKAGYEVQNDRSQNNIQHVPNITLNGGVEALLNGVVVNRPIPTGSQVIIRPTEFTRYGEVLANCRNSGFVHFQYQIGRSIIGSVDRPTGCEPPDISYAFQQSGTFTIKMIGKTRDGQVLEATTVLTVGRAADMPVTPGDFQGSNSGGGIYGPSPSNSSCRPKPCCCCCCCCCRR